MLPQDAPSYFRRNSKFTFFCKLDFQGWTKKTKEVTLEMDKTSAAVNETISFNVYGMNNLHFLMKATLNFCQTKEVLL